MTFTDRFTVRIRWVIPAALAVVLTVSSCGSEKGGGVEYDTNLLTNASFEKVGNDGLPEGWTLTPFRGIEGQETVRYGVDNTTAADGENSWYFKADPATRRWFALSQEVELSEEVTHVRMQGWMQLDQVVRAKDQWAQCNFLLTFYDENHMRFQEMRFADKRSRLRLGSQLWEKEDLVFRVPHGTRYVTFSALLAMDGTAWFDNVSLSVPRPLDWQTRETKNYVFHWFEGNPFPLGAIENQQLIFDQYCDLMKLESDIKIKYYLYPDTTTIRDVLSLKGYQYVSWDDLEIHTINPNDNHEVVHFITDEYGMPPRSIAEGTVFYLQDDWAGHPVDLVAAYRLARGELPHLDDITDYNRFAMIDPGMSLPAAASFIGYVCDNWGIESLMPFYRALNGVNSYAAFSQAFESVYGKPIVEAEQEWHAMLRQEAIEGLNAVPEGLPKEVIDKQ